MACASIQRGVRDDSPTGNGAYLSCDFANSASLNPVPDRGGGDALAGFSRAIPKQLEISSSYLVTFLNIICTYSGKKMPGQVRPGHQSGFVEPTSEKFAITP